MTWCGRGASCRRAGASDSSATSPPTRETASTSTSGRTLPCWSSTGTGISSPPGAASACAMRTGSSWIPTTTSTSATATSTRCSSSPPRARSSSCWAGADVRRCRRRSTTRPTSPSRPTGEIYVADGYGNSAVHRFSPEGQHLGSWGAPGGPRAVHHAARHLGRRRPRARRRSRERPGAALQPRGRLLREWRDLYHPMDIYVDGAGTVYVTDQIPRLSMYSPAGRLLARGRPAAIGAHGVWGDSRGNLYLAEVGLNQVTKLARRSAAGVSSRHRGPPDRSRALQPEGADEEDRHLGPACQVSRAESAGAAAVRDAPPHQLVHPRRERAAARHVGVRRDRARRAGTQGPRAPSGGARPFPAG